MGPGIQERSYPEDGVKFSPETLVITHKTAWRGVTTQKRTALISKLILSHFISAKLVLFTSRYGRTVWIDCAIKRRSKVMLFALNDLESQQVDLLFIFVSFRKRISFNLFIE